MSNPQPLVWTHANVRSKYTEQYACADHEIPDALFRWEQEGRGVAGYQNLAFDSHAYGQWVFVTYGSPAASIPGEPPETLPVAYPMHWAYKLRAVVPPVTHNSSTEATS